MPYCPLCLSEFDDQTRLWRLATGHPELCGEVSPFYDTQPNFDRMMGKEALEQDLPGRTYFRHIGCRATHSFWRLLLQREDEAERVRFDRGQQKLEILAGAAGRSGWCTVDSPNLRWLTWLLTLPEGEREQVIGASFARFMGLIQSLEASPDPDILHELNLQDLALIEEAIPATEIMDLARTARTQGTTMEEARRELLKRLRLHLEKTDAEVVFPAWFLRSTFPAEGNRSIRVSLYGRRQSGKTTLGVQALHKGGYPATSTLPNWDPGDFSPCWYSFAPSAERGESEYLQLESALMGFRNNRLPPWFRPEDESNVVRRTYDKPGNIKAVRFNACAEAPAKNKHWFAKLTGMLAPKRPRPGLSHLDGTTLIFQDLPGESIDMAFNLDRDIAQRKSDVILLTCKSTDIFKAVTTLPGKRVQEEEQRGNCLDAIVREWVRIHQTSEARLAIVVTHMDAVLGNETNPAHAFLAPYRPDQFFGGVSSTPLLRDLLEAWNAQRPKGVTDLPDLVQCIRKGELPIFFVQTTFPLDAPPQSDGLEGLLRWCMEPGELARVDEP